MYDFHLFVFEKPKSPVLPVLLPTSEYARDGVTKLFKALSFKVGPPPEPASVFLLLRLESPPKETYAHRVASC